MCVELSLRKVSGDEFANLSGVFVSMSEVYIQYSMSLMWPLLLQLQWILLLHLSKRIFPYQWQFLLSMQKYM